VSGEIDALWILHGIDEQIVQLDAALGRLPEERAALAKRLSEERTALERVKARLADLQKTRRDLEREVQSLSETEKRFQGQLQAIKKNEEYQALLHEIAATRGRRSDLETSVLESLEAEDQAQAQRPKLEQAIADVERDVSARLAQLEREESEARAHKDELEGRRVAGAEQLPAATRSRYERIRSSRGGRAVVAIQKGACGGCFRAQPPQVLQAARHRDKVLTCEGCGRLMVWPPDGDATP
jgi:predicted  nucleic acid-binding Zn-ribbon protein